MDQLSNVEPNTKRARVDVPNHQRSDIVTIIVSQLSGAEHAVDIPSILFVQDGTDEGSSAELKVLASDLKFEIARMVTMKKLFTKAQCGSDEKEYEVMCPHQNHCGAWRVEILSQSSRPYQDADFVNIGESALIQFVINANFEHVLINSDERFFEYFLKGTFPECGGPLNDMDDLEIDFDKIVSYDSAPKSFKFDCSDDDWDVMDNSGGIDAYVVHPIVCQVWNYLLDPAKCKSVLNCLTLLHCDDTDPAPCGKKSQLDQDLLRRKTCPLERLRLMRTQAWPFWQVPCLGGQSFISSSDAEWMGKVKLWDYSDGDERIIETQEALARFRADQACCFESCEMAASYGPE